MMRSMLSFAFAALLMLAAAAPASASLDLSEFDVTFNGEEGQAQMQAGSHPYSLRTKIVVKTKETSEGTVPDEAIDDLSIEQVRGFTGLPSAVPACSTADFLDRVTVPPQIEALENSANCADSSAIGMTEVVIGEKLGVNHFRAPVYSLEPPPGKVAKLGFWVLGIPVTVDIGVSEEPPYNILATTHKISQVLEFFSAELEIWGVPADPVHDADRGHCGIVTPPKPDICPASIPVKPFITSPRACSGPLATNWQIDSWEHPDIAVFGSALTHDETGPRGFSGCAALDFGPRIGVTPSTDEASSPSGLDVELNVDDEGFANPVGRASSDIKDMVLTLPKGMTLNPSLAEGLVACSEAQLANLTAASPPGSGCPGASKVGTVELQTPALPEKTLEGSLYIATPFENPTHSLIALYLVIHDPELGILVTQPLKVEPDPKTGQIVTRIEDIPQFPIAHVKAHLREGGRSPLISPPGCETYEAEADFTPWAAPTSVYSSGASFQITGNHGGGPCPPAGTPPFAPGFTAGSLDGTAGAYSPFIARLTRRDGDQDITRLSLKLPPGVVAKLAGVGECSDTAIAAAKKKSGREEQAAPSCPANSQIGSVQGGAGVGSQLTYVPGKLYLAGPVGGAPLSVVAIVPAVAGPYDVGNVVVRQALRIDPRTAEVEADGKASDPLPYILAGIPLKVRDIQISVDRPNFTINPTSCKPADAAATLWGGGSDPFSSADDTLVSLAQRFQASDCASLAFHPRLSMRLKGSTRRGGHPALRAVYQPRPGDANTSEAVVRLPRSAFLDQGHIRTVCTRVQFAADACPAGAVYGHAVAVTPLLDQPLEGPLYLRSSNHNLPDLVADLHGIVDVEAVGRVDSKNGGIRVSFEGIPDAALQKVVISTPAGKKGLIINSRNLCSSSSFATAQLSAHNGRTAKLRTQVRASSCPKPRAHHEHRRGRTRR